MSNILNAYRHVLKVPYGLYRSPDNKVPDLYYALRQIWKSGRQRYVLDLLYRICCDAEVHPENRIDASLSYVSYVIKASYRRESKKRFSYRRPSKHRLHRAIHTLQKSMDYTASPATRIRILDIYSELMSRVDPEEAVQLAVHAVRLFRDRMREARTRKRRKSIKRYTCAVPRYSILTLHRMSDEAPMYDRLLRSAEGVLPRQEKMDLRLLGKEEKKDRRQEKGTTRGRQEKGHH